MKISVSTDKLRDALQYVTDVIERRFTYPILSNVLFEVGEDGVLHLRATDHDLSLMADVETMSVAETGAVTIPGKKCLDVVRASSQSGEVMIHADLDGVTLTIGRSKFNLSTMPASEFPQRPNIEADATFTISTKDFVHLLQSAISTMGVGDVRPHLNGTLIELTSVHIRAVSSDGMSMCICTNKNYSVEGGEIVTALIPRKAVLELTKAFASVEDELEISVAANALVAIGSERSLITNLIESPFPAYMRIVPDASDALLKCDRSLFIQAIDQAATLADTSMRIYLDVSPDSMELMANTEAGDRAEVVIPVDFGDRSTKVAFKHDRLRRILDTFSCEEVALHLPEPRDVVRIDSDDEEELLFVVSPIRS